MNNEPKFSELPGHLFVVHGRIECVVHDAAVIPTDQSLRVEPYWAPLIGSITPVAPVGWEQGWGGIAGASNWLIDVAHRDLSTVLDRLQALLATIASTFARSDEGVGNLPLIALPILGVGAGGRAHDRGTVVRRLLDLLTGAARELCVDIVLVTPDAADYAAAQHHRRLAADEASCSSEAKRLGELARRGGLALFLGAGVSVPAGLPTWNQLIDSLAAHAPREKAELLKSLGPTDQAELLQRSSRREFAGRVVREVEKATRPSLLHALMAGFDVRQTVTTNYDRLFETAVAASGRRITSVMPWTPVGDDERWILKLHGDASRKDSIVLTRRHMVMYDAANRPSAALLQSLLLTKHILFVGVSFTDDNVIRLAHEVDAYRDQHQKVEDRTVAYATVLDAEPTVDTARRELWKDRLTWVGVRDEVRISSYRALAIFLDEVGIHASRDASWLLDPRYRGMLATCDERDLAKDVVDLLHRLPHTETWKPVREALKGFGAR